MNTPEGPAGNDAPAAPLRPVCEANERRADVREEQSILDALLDVPVSGVQWLPSPIVQLPVPEWTLPAI